MGSMKNGCGMRPTNLLAIVKKSLDGGLSFTLLYARLDRVTSELRSLLCTFENSTKCNKVSFNFDSYQSRPQSEFVALSLLWDARGRSAI